MKTRKLIGSLFTGAICFVLSGCSPVEILLHGDLSGYVTDAETDQPLQDATVILNPPNDTSITASDGKYLFTGLTPGNYEIEASKLSYAKILKDTTVTEGKSIILNFALDATPVINYSHTLLDFGYYLTSLSFTISKTGTGKVSYIATPSKNWITINPNSGDVENETDAINVTIDRTGLIKNADREWIVIRPTYQQYVSVDTIHVNVGVHKIIFNPNLTYGTVTDIEGNVYKTIVIGTQTWMAENLKTTKYNDNTSISLVTDKTAWSNLTTPGYCWYNNDSTTYRYEYGALYNWYTVHTGNLCPAGWHIPTKDEWTTMITFIGGSATGGIKLKETGTIHWKPIGIEATNEFGFTSIPGGCRNNTGIFAGIGISSSWWSATEKDTDRAWFSDISSDAGIDSIYEWDWPKKLGVSVRCMKNP